MDYEFLRDITGVVKVRMSMGHEVVGHWFNEEVKENLALLDEVETHYGLRISARYYRSGKGAHVHGA